MSTNQSTTGASTSNVTSLPTKSKSDKSKRNLLPLLGVLSLEGNLLFVMAGIMAGVITAYNTDPVPVLSYFFENLFINDALGGLAALVVVATPVAVFKAAHSSTILQNPIGFFEESKLNWLWFGLAALALAFVGGTEFFALYVKAKQALDLAPAMCPTPPGFCVQAELDHTRTELENQVKNAPYIAGFFTLINMTLGFFTASILHKLEK